MQALDKLIRTIGELYTRRLDRISRMDVQQQGNHGRGLGLHSTMVGRYIDVSALLSARKCRSGDECSASVHGDLYYITLPDEKTALLFGCSGYSMTQRGDGMAGLRTGEVGCTVFSLFSTVFGRLSGRRDKRRGWQLR